MNRIDRRIASPLCAAWVVLATPTIATAHEGHDEDKPAAAATAATAEAKADSPATPHRGAIAAGVRFAAMSDQFELVGVLDGRILTLYLDRFADNAPVRDARIELEIGAEKLAAKATGDVYTAELSAPPASGTTPVTATVLTGEATDLLAADLEWPARRTSTEQPPQAAAGISPFGSAIGTALAAAVAAGALGWMAARRRSRT